jgi:hypothetical protein
MKSKVVILCLTGFLWLLGLNGPVNSQSSDLAAEVEYDTIDIAIDYITAYPGAETWVTVWMKNPVPVAGFSLVFQLSSSDAARFSCDTTGHCFIDTTGCSASAFSNTISCVCEENGRIARTVGLMNPGEFIPPSPDYLCLFKIHIGICCIPDADTLREALVLLAPESSFLSDTLGDLVPLCYQMGQLFVWWSVPGDVNGDSLVNSADIVFLVNYLFRGGPEPYVCEAADCNNDGVIKASDIVYLVNHLFKNGPAPVRGSVSCPHEDCCP